MSPDISEYLLLQRECKWRHNASEYISFKLLVSTLPQCGSVTSVPCHKQDVGVRSTPSYYSSKDNVPLHRPNVRRYEATLVPSSIEVYAHVHVHTALLNYSCYNRSCQIGHTETVMMVYNGRIVVTYETVCGLARHHPLVPHPPTLSSDWHSFESWLLSTCSYLQCLYPGIPPARSTPWQFVVAIFFFVSRVFHDDGTHTHSVAGF